MDEPVEGAWVKHADSVVSIRQMQQDNNSLEFNAKGGSASTAIAESSCSTKVSEAGRDTVR